MSTKLNRKNSGWESDPTRIIAKKNKEKEWDICLTIASLKSESFASDCTVSTVHIRGLGVDFSGSFVSALAHPRSLLTFRSYCKTITGYSGYVFCLPCLDSRESSGNRCRSAQEAALFPPSKAPQQ